MGQLYDTVRASLSGTIPDTTSVIHFTDTWNGATMTGQVTWNGATPVTCDLSWAEYFTSNSLQGSPVGLHAIEAKAYDAGNNLLGTWDFNLQVPSAGLPILAIDAQADAMTHDAIYAIDKTTHVPSYLQQPAGTMLALPTAGATLKDTNSATATFEDAVIGVGPGKVYVANHFANASKSDMSDVEILSRPIGDHTSAWTHVAFMSDVIAVASGFTPNSVIGWPGTYFLVDASGGLWVQTTVGSTDLATQGGNNDSRLYHLPAGSTTWIDAWDCSAYSPIFFAGPKKTFPAVFSQQSSLNGGHQPALSVWDGNAFVTMHDITALGATWAQYIFSPVFALSAHEVWGCIYNPDNSGQLQFYRMTDEATDDPISLTCSSLATGDLLIFGDGNIWPTSLGVGVVWNIASGAPWASPYYIGAVFDPDALKLTPSILTPPDGDRFGQFPVTFLTPTATLSNASMSSWMIETQDEYILVALT